MSLSKQRFHSFYLHELILKMPTNQISLSVCKQYTLQKSGWLCGRGSVTCICNLTSLYSLIIVAEFSEPLASLQDTGKAKRIRYITRFSLVFTAVSVLSQPVLLNCQGLNLHIGVYLWVDVWQNFPSQPPQKLADLGQLLPTDFWIQVVFTLPRQIHISSWFHFSHRSVLRKLWLS